MKTIAAVSVLARLALPAAAQESMAQAAERQKKARKGQTKVITEDELRNNRSKGYSATSVDGAAPAATTGQAATPAGTPAAKEKTYAEVRAEKKTEFDQKIKQWTDFIADTKKQMERAQLELNDLSSATFGDRRAGLQRILDDGNQHVAEAQKEIANIEEQARRAGIAVSR